jgi:hypothetical protein
MKKILVLALFIANFFNAQAQLGLGSRFGLGVNFSNDSSFTKTQSAVSYSINGAFIADYNFSSLFALQSELQIITKGKTETLNAVQGKTGVSYLGLNLLPKIKFGGSKFEGFLFAGPSVGYLIDAHDIALSESSNVKDYYNDLDISAIAGLGASYKFGKNKIFTDLRYNHGFSNVNALEAYSLRLNQITLNVGFICYFK